MENPYFHFPLFTFSWENGDHERALVYLRADKIPDIIVGNIGMNGIEEREPENLVRFFRY